MIYSGAQIQRHFDTQSSNAKTLSLIDQCIEHSNLAHGDIPAVKNHLRSNYREC